MARQKNNKIVKQETKEDVMSEEKVIEKTIELESMEKELDRVRVELERTKAEIKELEDKKKFSTGREIDEEERALIKKQEKRSQNSSGLKDKIEKEKEKDNEMITGKFMNRRAPGQTVKLTYMKYADDPVKWFEFQDNKIYTIPRGFADQLNEYYYTPHFIQKTGEMDPNRPSSAINEVDTSNKKYAFVAINY